MSTMGLRSMGTFGLFVLQATRSSLRHPPALGDVVHEGWRIGWRALPILITISFFVGTNLALQGYSAFQPLGGQALLGMFVALAGVRELAPIMVAAMVAAKAGTEMASQIAVMRTKEQIDALEVMAVDPYAWLVAPRFLGIVLVLPALTVVSIFTLIASAWLVTVHQLGENGVHFLTLVAETTTGVDLVVCSVKSAIFGVTICLVSCYHGFHSQPGPKGVGAATNAAVVVSAVACAIANYLVSQAVYG